MNKFQKFQKWSSLVPGISTAFVTFVTMFELKKQKASFKLWLYFLLTFFLSGATVYLVNTFIMSGKHPVLDVIASGCILALANIIMVNIQIAAIKANDKRGFQPEQEEKKKRSGNKIAIICVVSSVVGFVGLLGYMLAMVLYIENVAAPRRMIEDTNGSEDTTLEVITVDDFLKDNNYSAINAYRDGSGEQTNVTGRNADYDYDTSSFSCTKVSGVVLLQATNTDADQLVLEINSKVVKGNVEIVIVVDGEYNQSVDINQVCSVELSGISGKDILVKLGAESAEVSVTITRKIG